MSEIKIYTNDNIYLPDYHDDIILRHRGKLEKKRKFSLPWKKYTFILENDQLSYYIERNQVSF